MTRLNNTAEGGVVGQTVTPANSGGASGDAFTSAPISGGSIVFDNTRAADGGKSIKVTPPASGLNSVTFATAGGSRVSVRGKFYLTAAPVNGLNVIRVGVGTTNLASVDLRGTGKARVNSAAGGSGVYTSTANYPLNSWVRLELDVTIGTTTSNGRIVFAMYANNSTTPIESWDSGATMNTGTVNADTARFGGFQTTSDTTPFWMDSLAFDDAAAGFIGPVVNLAPVVSITGAQNLAAGSTANVSVTATDDGSIASYAWSVVSASSTATPTLTGASTASASFTVPAAGNLVTLQCVVTDDQGATTTVTTEVRVPKSGSFATLAVAGIGSWTNVGGAANMGAALADSSDTTYVESPDYTGTESEQRWRLEPLNARTALTLVYRNQVTATGGTKKFRLYEGNVMRQEWAVPVHTAIQDDTFTVTTPGAISDWGNLWVAEAVTA